MRRRKRERRMIAKQLNSASISDIYCSACGWPVVDACCNDQMGKLHPESDWWWYCSNQGCIHHEGEEYGVNNTPKWVFRLKSVTSKREKGE